MHSRSSSIGLGLLLLLQLAAYAGLAAIDWRHGTLAGEQVPRTIGLLLAAFAVYGLTLWWVESRRVDTLALLWIGAVALRAVLLFTEPSLSADVFRYLWDGHVANHGVSPYALPIESPALDFLDVPIRSQADHAWMASPYMPAAQGLFVAVTRLLPLRPLSMQLAMVVVDLGNGLLLLALLSLAGLPRMRALIYLWNPLVVVEVAQGAHVDAWMILLSLAAVLLALQHGIHHRFSRWLSPLLLALATLTKFLPALLLPVLYWRWHWPQRLLYAAAVMGLLIPAGLRAGWGLTGPLDGTGLFGAVRIYGDRWNYNSGLFHWLEASLFPVVGVADAETWARRAVALGMLTVVIVVWWQAKRAPGARAALRWMAVPLAAYVLLSPTMHPWYLLLLLAFVPFLPPAAGESGRRWLWAAPWLHLSGALALSYYTYVDPGNLREYEWVRRMEWIPTLALLLLAAGVWLKDRGHATVQKRSSGSGYGAEDD